MYGHASFIIFMRPSQHGLDIETVKEEVYFFSPLFPEAVENGLRPNLIGHEDLYVSLNMSPKRADLRALYLFTASSTLSS